MNILTVDMRKNPCYKRNAREQKRTHLIVHTPAVAPIVIHANRDRRSWAERWNDPEVEKLVHFFVDDDAVYRFAPDDMQCWHVGNDYGNRYAIGAELCEVEPFDKVWRNAVELFADLADDYDIPTKNILGHCEAHAAGIASNHSDPVPWFKAHGKTMDMFRAEVDAVRNGRVNPANKKLPVATVDAVKTKNTGLNLRNAPDPDATKICNIPDYSVLELIRYENNGWVYVKYGIKTGYVNGYYLSGLTAYKKVRSNDGYLNMRANPNGSIIKPLPNGTIVAVVGTGRDSDGDNWNSVSTYYGEGFVWPDYLQAIK